MLVVDVDDLACLRGEAVDDGIDGGGRVFLRCGSLEVLGYGWGVFS